MARPRTRAVGQVEVFDAAIEADFAADRFDPLPQRLDHGRQPIAAQVRAMIVEDRRLALALGKQFAARGARRGPSSGR